MMHVNIRRKGDSSQYLSLKTCKATKLSLGPTVLTNWSMYTLVALCHINHSGVEVVSVQPSSER